MYCKTCGEGIRAEDVNIDLAIAKCGACNAVFGFADQLDGDEPTRGRRKRGAVPLPAGVKVDELGPGLTLVRRWFSPVLFFLLFFCIAWDAFLVFWYGMAFTEDAPWIMIVFPVAHVAVGVGLTYFTIAGFLNRTVVRVANGRLTVRHGPMPWFGNHTLPDGEIEQLYCTEHVSRSRNSGPSITYRVNAALRNGGKLKLLSGLNEVDQALFIEEKLEHHLGIRDRPVRGEIRR